MPSARPARRRSGKDEKKLVELAVECPNRCGRISALPESEQHSLPQCWRQIERELVERHEGKVQGDDLVRREGELLAEQDEIEFEIGTR
ncbi:MAG: hypothetical protein IID37_07595 [Planctomycetes bacterium]|nr:hypothetical protein [Planctomycetota bacterium]